MIEVELFDDDRGPRNFSKELTAVNITQFNKNLFKINNDKNNNVIHFQLRKEVIDQKTGNKIMNTKYHMDDMVRLC